MSVRAQGQGWVKSSFNVVEVGVGGGWLGGIRSSNPTPYTLNALRARKWYKILVGGEVIAVTLAVFSPPRFYAQCFTAHLLGSGARAYTQQFTGYDVDRAKESKTMLNIIRDVVIFQK